MTRSPTQDARVAHAVADAGLRCAECGYNLTGLTSQRCPECGTAFDPQDPRIQTAPPPQIAFERQRGLHRLGGWLVTWVTVLLLPWKFARQVTIRGSAAWATAFLLLCLLWGPVALLIDADWDVIRAWWCAVAITLPPQVVLLTLLDLTHWRRPLRSLRFWWIVSCYTSAVLVLEAFLGTPLITLQSLRDVVYQVVHGRPIDAWPPELFAPTWAALAAWGEVTLWITAVTCCFAARLRPRGWGWAWAGPYLMLYPLLLLVAYAASVEYIRIRILAGVFF